MFHRKNKAKCIAAAYAFAIASATLLLQGGTATAATSIQAPDCAHSDPKCFKEIRIVNNLPTTMYAVVQASIIMQPALPVTNGPKCPVGDPWLQRALQATPTSAITGCYPVTRSYYVYLNPKTGIPPGATVSIQLPWWLKTNGGPGVDRYIDFWNAGRIYFYDDKKSFNDSYTVNTTNANVYNTLATGSNKLIFDSTPGLPKIKCTALSTVPGNKCDPSQIVIAAVNPTIPGSTIGPPSFYQLNEYTFADVTKPAQGGDLIDLNQNYNVSNVDQVYLPVALAPVQKPATVGYLGTVMGIGKFRAALKKFTGADTSLDNPAFWPVYNNPVINTKTGERLYPSAGVRVPSPLSLFGFYMNPGTFRVKVDGVMVDAPYIVPFKRPWTRASLPKLVREMEENWDKCSSDSSTCPRADWYKSIKAAFDLSYSQYQAASACAHPAWLGPKSPTLKEAYLYFVSGWVPFRNGSNCGAAQVPELPVTQDPPSSIKGKGKGGEAPFYYTDLQYDWSLPTNPAKGADIFNPYTKLVHGSGQYELDAATYAFSIDDRESYLNNSGGQLPGGLIFAVGGSNGLVVKTPAPKATPIMLDWYTARVALGGPNTKKVGWKKYGICSNTADSEFLSNDPGGFGLNPNVLPTINSSNTCMITLEDQAGKIYQFKLKRLATTGSLPIVFWPQPYTGGGQFPAHRDATVKCVDNSEWCTVGLIETAQKPQFPLNKPVVPPKYYLTTRVPE